MVSLIIDRDLHLLSLLINVMLNTANFVAPTVWQCLCWPNCLARIKFIYSLVYLRVYSIYL
jgi:hypothetical protein